MDLNERKLRILKSLIDEYIVNGEPVGSKHLVEYGNISLSPATIRNEMSELEEMGYLDKPHTSAGRIPSNAAYRVYVEKLMESYRLNVEELSLLNELTRFKMDEMDKLMSKATKIISEITNCATVGMMTSEGKYVVKRFDALLIDDFSFVLVMVLPDDSIKTQHIKTELQLDKEAVERIKNSLNKHLCSVSLKDVSLPVILELEKEFGRYSYLVTTVIRTAYEAVCGKTEGEIKVDGIMNLLSYPEFTDVNKVKNILSLVENEQGKIKDLLDTNVSGNADGEVGNKLKIYIGDENTVEELSDTSVVFCSLPVGNGQNAVLGILGPKRMDYKKVISALSQLADNISGQKLIGTDENNT